MKKVILADDEKVILGGLKKLISWPKLDFQIVGEAGDGEKLLELIRRERPDLVVTDIMMPKMTGLEVIAATADMAKQPKFIFVSGYQEFSYAQEALSRGAVAYLLKPVSRKDLEAAVIKVSSMITSKSAVELFQDDKTEIQKFFAHINDGYEYATDELYQMFSNMNLDYVGKEFLGITFGFLPHQSKEFEDYSVEKQNLIRFSVFNQICDMFREQKNGFCIRTDEDRVHIMGILPKGQREQFKDTVILPYKTEIEQERGVFLEVGIGIPVSDVSDLKQAYKTSNYAYDFYFFEENAVVDVEKIHNEVSITDEDYENGCDKLFNAILARDGTAMQEVSNVMSLIRDRHYGRPTAVRMRTMLFTGDLASKLSRYHLLEYDLDDIQTALEKQVEEKITFRELKNCVMEYYENLIRQLYETSRYRESAVMEKVKDYIREHYAEEMSIPKLAEVACVSPNYFSAFFKKETGENYKAYLTRIRMEEALKLVVDTDLRSYEISERVGYNNDRRFVDTFRETYGVSPSEYRKRR